MRSTQVSRREFLERSGTALVAAGLAGALPARIGAGEERAGQSPWPLRLSTSTVQFSSLSVEKACERIAALGFAAVDFWPSGFGCPHLDEMEKRLGPEGLKDLLAKHNLKLYAFTCYNVGANAGYSRFAELLGKAGGGLAVREAKYG
jgi:hypothetical protein